MTNMLPNTPEFIAARERTKKALQSKAGKVKGDEETLETVKLLCDMALDLPAALSTITALHEENKKLRKIAAFVPGAVYIKAKEEAGFGEEVKC